MRLEIEQLIAEISQSLVKAILVVNPIFTWICGVFMFILFPNATYILYAKVLCIAVVVDLITKYYAISIKNGGLKQALMLGKLNSHSMWMGTRKKLVGYFAVMLLVGLSNRFEIVEMPIEFFSTIAYAIMFFREAQSILENMIEAGHTDLKWLHSIIKNRKEDLLGQLGGEEAKEEEKKEGVDLSKDDIKG